MTNKSKMKNLQRQRIQALLDSGRSQRDVAHALGLPSPNYVSMLLSNRDKSVLSLNRIPQLTPLCGMSNADVIQLALARVAAADGAPVEMSPETFKFLLKTFAKLAHERGFMPKVVA